MWVAYGIHMTILDGNDTWQPCTIVMWPLCGNCVTGLSMWVADGRHMTILYGIDTWPPYVARIFLYDVLYN